MKKALLYFSALLCLALPSFGVEPPAPESKDALLRSLSCQTVTIPSFTERGAGQNSVAFHSEQRPKFNGDICYEGQSCTYDYQCAPGACAAGSCFCGCSTNRDCTPYSNNCGLDGYCLNYHCFCF